MKLYCYGEFIPACHLALGAAWLHVLWLVHTWAALQAMRQASWYQSCNGMSLYLSHASDSAQVIAIWRCESTLTSNLTLIFQALSHHCSNHLIRTCIDMCSLNYSLVQVDQSCHFWIRELWTMCHSLNSCCLHCVWLQQHRVPCQTDWWETCNSPIFSRNSYYWQ